MRNTVIDFALNHFPSDCFLITDDDILINSELFRFLEKMPSKCMFTGFHCYSIEFKRDLITKQNNNSLFFGEITNYVNTSNYDILPENIFPDQIYFVKTEIIQEMKKKFGKWFYSNSEIECEARVFVANAKKLCDIYIANITNIVDFDYKETK